MICKAPLQFKYKLDAFYPPREMRIKDDPELPGKEKQ